MVIRADLCLFVLIYADWTDLFECGTAETDGVKVKPQVDVAHDRHYRPNVDQHLKGRIPNVYMDIFGDKCLGTLSCNRTSVFFIKFLKGVYALFDIPSEKSAHNF